MILLLNSIVAVTAVIAFAFGIFVFGGISSAVIPLVSLVVLVDTGAVFAMMGATGHEKRNSDSDSVCNIVFFNSAVIHQR